MRGESAERRAQPLNWGGRIGFARAGPAAALRWLAPGPGRWRLVPSIRRFAPSPPGAAA